MAKVAPRDDVRIGERILHNRLHDDAAGGKARADDGGEQKARQAKQPDDVMDRTLARHVDGRAALYLIEKRSGDRIGRQIDRSDGERPEECANEKRCEQG